MKDLIEALTIFLKYKNEGKPHALRARYLYVAGVTKEEVSEEDKEKLDELGFFFSDDEGSWISFKFGSA